MTFRRIIGIACALVGMQALVLYLFGQPPICTCGTVKLWEGIVLGPGNSQHLSDWYSFSHVIHGFIFYAVLAWLVPNIPVRTRILIALGVEIAWEITENTPMVINHYREQALAVGYAGDSIINSVSDSLMMALGYVVAWKFPRWATLVVALALELFVGYMIRDNLTLNIINLIHPVQAISDWQLSGGIK